MTGYDEKKKTRRPKKRIRHAHMWLLTLRTEVRARRDVLEENKEMTIIRIHIPTVILSIFLEQVCREQICEAKTR